MVHDRSQSCRHNWHVLRCYGVGQRRLSKTLLSLTTKLLLLLRHGHGLLRLWRGHYIKTRCDATTTCTRRGRARRCSTTWHTLFSACSQLCMNFGMSLFFIRSSKLSPTSVTRERFLASMSSDMCCEMVGPWKASHTNSTLERFLTSMNSNMSCQFVWPTEPTVTTFYRTSVGPLMNWSFTWTIRIATWFDWDES